MRIALLLGGEPRIAGTRISVRDIMEYMRAYDGEAERVLRELPNVSDDDVKAAMTYYATHRQESDAYIRQDERAEEKLLRRPS